MPDDLTVPPVQPPSEPGTPPVTPPAEPPVVPPVTPPVEPPVVPPAPIVYDLKLGENSLLSQADVDETLATAKDKNLTPEQATLLLSQREAAATAFNNRQLENLKTTVAGWADQVKADKDLGGTNYDATIKHVKTAMDRFAPEGSALRTILNETGYGNHPELVRFVAAIGKAMGEDPGLGGHANAGGGNQQDVPLEKKLYPNR